jgi:hypothetical protein
MQTVSLLTKIHRRLTCVCRTSSLTATILFVPWTCPWGDVGDDGARVVDDSVTTQGPDTTSPAIHCPPPTRAASRC